MRQFRRFPVSAGTSWAGPARRTVALIGGASGCFGLATYLPTGWRLVTTDRFEALTWRPDVIVLTGPSAAEVTRACQRRRQARTVAAPGNVSALSGTGALA